MKARSCVNNHPQIWFPGRQPPDLPRLRTGHPFHPPINPLKLGNGTRRNKRSHAARRVQHPFCDAGSRRGRSGCSLHRTRFRWCLFAQVDQLLRMTQAMGQRPRFRRQPMQHGLEATVARWLPVLVGLRHKDIDGTVPSTDGVCMRDRHAPDPTVPVLANFAAHSALQRQRQGRHFPNVHCSGWRCPSAPQGLAKCSADTSRDVTSAPG